MPTIKTESIAKQQKITKPTIDEIVINILQDENLANATNLISFIRENKISLRWSSTNCWQLYYKSKRIGVIRMTEKAYPMYILDENSWLFSPWDSHDIIDTLIDDENAKNIIWNNVRLCSNCASCGPGSERMVLGKKIEKTCHGWLNMINPNMETVECIKQIIKIKKNQLDYVAT